MRGFSFCAGFKVIKNNLHKQPERRAFKAESIVWYITQGNSALQSEE